MKERILQLIKELGVSGREFSRNIGKSESFARTITGSIGTDVLVEIIRAYPSVNLYWLVTGEGDMFRKETCKNYNIEPSECIPPDILIDYLKEKDRIIGDLREKIGSLKHELSSANRNERRYINDTVNRNVAEEEMNYSKSDDKQ